MKKWGALLLAAAMLLAMTACSEESQAGRVVAVVNGENITRGEAQPVLDFISKQTVYYYAQYYGYTVDPTDRAFVSEMKTSTLNIMAERLAYEQALEALGAGLTEEDHAAIEEQAVQEYEDMIASYVSSNGVTEDEARLNVDAQGYSLDAFRFELRSDKVDEKLRDAVSGNLSVTEAEIQAQYDTNVSSAQTAYETTPGQYGSDVVNGNTIYVVPEGYRYIKNLVIGLPDEIQEQLTVKSNEMYNILYEEYLLESEMSSATDADEDTVAANEARLEELGAQYDALEAEYDALVEEGREQVRAHAEEVLALCRAEGADFDALMAEYGSDSPSDGIIKTQGYPVGAASTTYVTEFTEGAMALENVGDISDLIASDYGFHILLYNGDIEPGIVPLEDVSAEIEASLLTTKQDNALSAKKTEIVNQATITTYISRLG